MIKYNSETYRIIWQADPKDPGKKPLLNPEIDPESSPDENPGINPTTDPDYEEPDPFAEPEIGDDPSEEEKKIPRMFA